MRSSLGPTLVIAGGVLVLVGLAAWTGWLSWFGHLPGDIRIERQGTRIYVPITSMVLVSIVISVALTIIRRLA